MIQEPTPEGGKSQPSQEPSAAKQESPPKIEDYTKRGAKLLAYLAMDDIDAEQALMTDKNIPLHSVYHGEAGPIRDEWDEWDLKTKDEIIDGDTKFWRGYRSIKQVLSGQQGWDHGTKSLQQYHAVGAVIQIMTAHFGTEADLSITGHKGHV